jgi:predicted enzyme related to lactoylglutathione lyase
MSMTNTSIANTQGDFIWYELLTGDIAAAQDFYSSVLEWTIADSGMPGMDYRIVNATEGSIGGMMQITPEMAENGACPAWVGYIAVDSVDASVTGITGAGGSVLMPAMDIPGVGRIAMVADPHGAPFYIMTPAGEGESHAFSKDRPRIGHCAWNELITPDQAASWAFYGEQFGWENPDSMDMGPMGSYQFIGHNGMLGAMMKGTPEMGPPHWNQYFRVADIDAAVAAIKAGGGSVINGPMEIPGGDYSLNGIDPQGAHFGLVGTKV